MNLHKRKSPRRIQYDYASAGSYFVTICTKNRQNYFGEIKNWLMIFNELWEHCYLCRNNILKHYPFVSVEEFVVMPNHIHWIITIGNHQWNSDRKDSNSDRRDVSHTSDTPNIFTTEDVKYYVPTTNMISLWIQPKSWSLGSIIRGFKIGVTTYAKSGIHITFSDAFARQSRYHDHIIRDQTEYDQIKYYIQTNPQNRENDTFNK